MDNLLKHHTNFKFGGPAKKIITAKSEAELIGALADLKFKKTKYYILGGGTNIIANDKGYDGVIVKIATGNLKISGKKIICEAGLPLGKLVSAANSAGLSGLETLAGIPGTVGGAIYGNAGAYGRKISEFLKKVKIFDGKNSRWLPQTSCGFKYRESVFSAKGGPASGGKKKPWVILSASFKLIKGDAKKLIKKSREIIKIREKKYKPNLRCAGSIFKNVLVEGGKIPAGSLLESIGAKGMRIGGVYVPHQHANLIINNGRGKAADAKKLIDILKKKVYREYGIRLEEEVQYLGF
ncbi:MAG: UDP-N-acetylmuramate dehydrogenase [Candidatus Giovannonibacteria bacterium]|nr:UDP-N-acetylmuramate dehydrogenase [Candidatus Giovannonibacteria bacterium]